MFSHIFSISSRYNEVKGDMVCQLSLSSSRSSDRARNARYSLGIMPVTDKGEKEQEQLEKTFRL